MTVRDRIWDWVWVALIVGGFGVASGVRVQDGVVAAGATPLPSVCWLRANFDIACPTCGMTRSFVSLVHGDWSGAVGWHPMGPVLALWLLVVLVMVPVEAYRGRASVSGRRWFQNVFIAIVLLSVVGGAIRGVLE